MICLLVCFVKFCCQFVSSVKLWLHINSCSSIKPWNKTRHENKQKHISSGVSGVMTANLCIFWFSFQNVNLQSWKTCGMTLFIFFLPVNPSIHPSAVYYRDVASVLDNSPMYAQVTRHDKGKRKKKKGKWSLLTPAVVNVQYVCLEHSVVYVISSELIE